MTADRCPATNPYRYAWWVVPGERCTRPTGHDGPHTIPQRSQDGLLLANAQWFWWPEKTVAADEPLPVTEEQLADAIAGAPVVETISYRRDVLGEFPPDAEPQRADEPVSVPPPVDALLTLIARYGQYANDEAHAVDDAGVFASQTFRQIEIQLGALWASGVAEGRKIAEAEFDNRSTYELAGLVHRYLHVEAPDNSDPVQVAIEVLEEAIQDHGTVVTLETRGVAEGRRQLEHAEKVAAVHAYELGMAEGRRQATEERTEEQREHRVDVTEKSCLGVGPGHGWGKPHFWRCSTPGCMGHLCRMEAVDRG